MISSGPTSNPAPRSVNARSFRVCVVVFVTSRKGTLSRRSHLTVSGAPAIGSHETVSTPSISSRTPSITRASCRAGAYVGHPVLVRLDEPVLRGKRRSHQPERRQRGAHRELLHRAPAHAVSLAERRGERAERPTRDT